MNFAVAKLKFILAEDSLSDRSTSDVLNSNVSNSDI